MIFAATDMNRRRAVTATGAFEKGRVVRVALMTLTMLFAAFGAQANNTAFDSIWAGSFMKKFPKWHYKTEALGGCLVCHSTNNLGPGQPAPLNPFGVDAKDKSYNYNTIGDLDSDGDGAPNTFEILFNYFPGNPASKPPPPFKPTASYKTFLNKIQLKWDLYKKMGAVAKSMQIFRSNCSSSKEEIALTAVGITTFDDTTAPGGANYCYWIKACNSKGCTDFSSHVVGAKGFTPGAPSGVSATDGKYMNKIEVTWNKVSGVNKYKLYRSTSSTPSGSGIPFTSSSGPNVSTVTIAQTNVTPGKIYNYWVKACSDAACSNYSTPDKGSTVSLIKVPTLQRKLGLKVPGPGPKTAPVMKKAAPVMKDTSRATTKDAPELKSTSPAVTIAPAKRGTVDSPTAIDVPTLKLLVPRK